MLTKQVNQQNRNKIQKAAAFLLAMLPILHTYGWGQLDFGLISTLCLFVIIIFKKRLQIGKLPKYLNVYLLYYLGIWLLEALRMGNNPIPSGWIKIYVIYFTFFSCVKCNYFVKYYSTLAQICIGFLFLQNILLLIGIKFFGVATFLPWSFDEELATDYLVRMAQDDWRMSSFLIEPAECAQYLMPYFALILFSRNDKNKWVKCSLVILAFFLLRSGNAMIIVALIMACYILWLIFSHPTVTKWIALGTIGIISMVGGSYYLTTESGKELLDRQEEVSMDGDTKKQSAFQRIFRGYFVFDALNPLEKIIGANNKTLILQAQRRSAVWFSFGEDDFYCNAVQDIMIKTGIIGCIIFLMMLITLYRDTTLSGKAIIVGMIGICFIASILFTYKMLIYLFMAARLHETTHKKSLK